MLKTGQYDFRYIVYPFASSSSYTANVCLRKNGSIVSTSDSNIQIVMLTAGESLELGGEFILSLVQGDKIQLINNNAIGGASIGSNPLAAQVYNFAQVTVEQL